MEKEISRATLKRLPTYLAYLKAMPDSSGVNISATALAAAKMRSSCESRFFDFYCKITFSKSCMVAARYSAPACCNSS